MNSVLPLPALRIEIDGSPMSPEAVYALTEVRVQQRLSLPALCELAFSGLTPAGQDDHSFALGASLRVAVEDSPEPLFAGETTAVEHVYGASGGRELRVRGYDALHRLHHGQPVRAHVDITAVSLAEELLAPLGVAVQPGAQAPTWQTLVQHGQSDLALLTEIAEQAGLYFVLRDNLLQFLTLEGSGDPVALTLGETLLEARIEVNSEAALASVTATGWDPLHVEQHTREVAQPRTQRRSSAAPSVRRNLAGLVVGDVRHAELLAQAELDRRTSRETVLWGVAQGDPRLQPGTLIQVGGVANDLAGRYVLTAVTHTIDARKGFVSELSTMPPTSSGGEAPRATGTMATYGVVTRVDDPENLGRIRVSLPTYTGVETDWLQVLSIGGGSSKGLLILPDVGDSVLVLTSPTNPGHGVVLGGLFGRGGSPDSGVEGGGVHRYALWTAGGQRVLLDDTKGTVRLENNDGSFLEFSPEGVRLHAERNLEIDAPGRSIVVRAASVDFERG